MELEYRFIVEHLEKHFTVFEKNDACTASYGPPSTLKSVQGIKPKRTYLVECENFYGGLTYEDALFIVCCDRSSPSSKGITQVRHPKARCQIIAVDAPPSEVPALYEELFDLFHREICWQERLWSLSLTGGGSPIKEYLRVSAEMFDNALLYLPLGGYRRCIWAESDNPNAVRPINLLSDDSETYAEEASFESLGVVIGTSEPMTLEMTDRFGENIHVLVASTRESGGRYIGMFLTPVNGNTASEAQIRHIRTLRDHWEAILNVRSAVTGGEEFTSYGLLKSLALEGGEKLGDIEWRLEALGFLSGASYLCASIEFHSPGSYQTIPLETHLSTIDAMGNGVFTIKNSAVSAYVVFDDTANDMSIEEFLGTIQDYIEPTKIKAGISYPFTDILSLRNYARQADAALAIGRTVNPKKDMHPFGSVATRYILDNGTSELPAHMLCAPGLLRLYDKAACGVVDYVKTLQTYFECLGNVSVTAKELNVHRSTLLYRLDHISEITQMDLHNPEDCLYLKLSLTLLQRDK